MAGLPKPFELTVPLEDGDELERSCVGQPSEASLLERMLAGRPACASTLECRYWDEEQQRWSTDGCATHVYNGTGGTGGGGGGAFVGCACSHLSDFVAVKVCLTLTLTLTLTLPLTRALTPTSTLTVWPSRCRRTPTATFASVRSTRRAS